MELHWIMKDLIKVKYLTLLIIVLLSVSLLLYYVFNKWLVLKDFQVQLSAQPAWEKPEEEIHAVIQEKLNPFLGKRMWKINLDELKSTIQSEPYIGSVKILRLLPDRFLVQLSARRPVLVLLDSKGKMHPLSVDGKFLPPLSPKQAPDLPILRDNVFFNKEELRKLAIQFILLLPQTGLFSQGNISEISYISDENSFAFVLSSSGRPVKVGLDPGKLRTKRIESVLHYLNQQSIKWRVIDARFSQKIVVSTSKAI